MCEPGKPCPEVKGDGDRLLKFNLSTNSAILIARTMGVMTASLNKTAAKSDAPVGAMEAAKALSAAYTEFMDESGRAALMSMLDDLMGMAPPLHPRDAVAVSTKLPW
jgi:hypothetical protein